LNWVKITTRRLNASAIFLAGRPSTGPGPVIPSYTHGVQDLDRSGHAALPDYAIAANREPIPVFDKMLLVSPLTTPCSLPSRDAHAAPIRMTAR
jgi:hypothetical protein